MDMDLTHHVVKGPCLWLPIRICQCMNLAKTFNELFTHILRKKPYGGVRSLIWQDSGIKVLPLIASLRNRMCGLGFRDKLSRTFALRLIYPGKKFSWRSGYIISVFSQPPLVFLWSVAGAPLLQLSYSIQGGAKHLYIGKFSCVARQEKSADNAARQRIWHDTQILILYLSYPSTKSTKL